MAFGWKLVGTGSGNCGWAALRPDERLSWPKAIGVGAQHVVAMFGATFVFPLIMGLNANLAIMTSGVCTILFLLVVNNKILPTWAPAPRSWAR
jgi:xanthine/uracil permease